MVFKDYRYACVPRSILAGCFDTNCLAVGADKHFIFARNLVGQRQSQIQFRPRKQTTL